MYIFIIFIVSVGCVHLLVYRVCISFNLDVRFDFSLCITAFKLLLLRSTQNFLLTEQIVKENILFQRQEQVLF